MEGDKHVTDVRHKQVYYNIIYKQNSTHKWVFNFKLNKSTRF